MLLANSGYVIFQETPTETENTVAGIYLPETAQKNKHMIFGKVISAGGPSNQHTFVDDYDDGDTIATLRNKTIPFYYENVEYFLVHTTDIMFRVDDKA